MLRRDGAPLPVEVKVRTLTDGRAQAFVRDIRERKQTETALRDADRRKDEFLAMLAHELRNPLAPIRNALHVLKLQGPHDPTIDQTAKIMTRQVDHMVRLVDDLLDVSRITRGKITLRRESIVLNDVAARAIEAARPLIDARRHALDVELPTDELCLRADGNRLAQVITNLLINAAKFTPENGNLKLSIRRSVDEAIITVSDDGVGIAPDALRSIFDLFVQADATLDRAQGGLGIGLTLFLFLRYSKLGWALRATAQDRDAAQQMPQQMLRRRRSLIWWQEVRRRGRGGAPGPRSRASRGARGSSGDRRSSFA